MDVSQAGPIEQLTYYVTQALQDAFSGYQLTMADGSTSGVPVSSFYAEVAQPWPGLVVRVHPGETQTTAIGNVGEVNLDSVPPDAGSMGTFPGTTTETVIAGAASLEVRIGARSEVERERLVDWVWRALKFRSPTPSGVPVLDRLAGLGVTPLTVHAPVLPDMDPSAPRPQGSPPWPAQVFATCRVEFSLTLPAELTLVDVALPSTLTNSTAAGTLTASGS